MKNKPQLVFYIFSIAAFTFVVYYLYAHRADVKLIEEVNVLWLLVSVLAQLTTYLFSAFIYRILLGIFQPGMQINLWQLYRTSLIALFANQVVPLAGISGNVVFYNFLKHKKITVQNIFIVVVAELLCFYAATELIILAALFVYFFFYKTSWLFLLILIAGFIIYILLGFGTQFIGRKETVNKLSSKLSKIKLLGKVAGKLKKLDMENNEKVQISLPLIIQHKQEIVQIILLEAGIFFADISTLYALFYGLGVHVSFSNILVAFILTKIISLLPISPGALILYESSLTFFLTKLGAPLGTTVMVTLLFRVLSFWLPMPVGFLLTGKLGGEVIQVEK